MYLGSGGVFAVLGGVAQPASAAAMASGISRPKCAGEPSIAMGLSCVEQMRTSLGGRRHSDTRASHAPTPFREHCCGRAAHAATVCEVGAGAGVLAGVGLR